jgi:hypothetical protein
LAAKDLLHHTPNVTAFANAMTVTAMSARDVIATVKLHTNTDGRCFFAGIEMHKSGNLSRCKLLVHTLLEFTDRTHLRVDFSKIFAAELHLSSSLFEDRAGARYCCYLPGNFDIYYY